MPSANATSSPFFAPSTPRVVAETPGGTKRTIKKGVEETKSSVLGATANLINAIVGSGIVGIPYAMQQAGLVTGIGLVCLCAFLTEKSLRLLVTTAKQADTPSYETVMEAAFGRFGFLFVSINMFIMAYGAMVSYLMIVKDTLPYIFGISDLGQRRALLFLISLVVMVPLSSQRDMANLAYTSRLSVVLDIVMVSIVAYLAPITEMVNASGGIWEVIESSTLHLDTVFVGLGVLSFAFVCQHSAFIIAGSLERPTQKRWDSVTLRALWVCAVLANLCGITGFLGFQEGTQGNILNNLDAHGLMPNIARGLLGTTMLFVYPMESFVARHVCVVTFFAGRRAHDGDDSTILNRRDRRIGLTVFLYVLALVPALLFENLGNVLSVTGAIGGSSLSYIGPGAVYIGIHGGALVEMAQKFWKFGSGGVQSHHDTVSAIAISTAQDNAELQPLQATASRHDSSPEETTAVPAAIRDSLFTTGGKTILWYILGMPLWYSLASTGANGYTNYKRELALKSPHASRISRKPPARGALSRAGSASNVAGSYQGGASLGSSILPPPNPAALKPPPKKKAAVKKQESEEEDEDKIPVTPDVVDFVIAVCYILFGLVALSAGLLSIFVAETA